MGMGLLTCLQKATHRVNVKYNGNASGLSQGKCAQTYAGQLYTGPLSCKAQRDPSASLAA